MLELARLHKLPTYNSKLLKLPVAQHFAPIKLLVKLVLVGMNLPPFIISYVKVMFCTFIRLIDKAT